jgi:proline iminopeptidase
MFQQSVPADYNCRMFPSIEPFAAGLLPVGDGHEIYWEASGNPDGKPALWLHGGPGSGITGGYRRNFDPERFLIVSFEQRGCGRSRPLATDPAHDTATNTTPALIGDIERLREHLGVNAWLLTGGSRGPASA